MKSCPLVSAVLVGALGLLAASCAGAKHSRGIASLGTPATTTSPANASRGAQSPASGGGGSTALVAFVVCLQKHGIQAQLEHGGGGWSPPPNSPQGPVEAAQKACQKLLPEKPLTPAEQAQNTSELVTLAACMRSHGYPNFPDPSSQGIFHLSASSGLNPNSRQLQAAIHTCTPHGARFGFTWRFPGPDGK